jgi:hypothetical protein
MRNDRRGPTKFQVGDWVTVPGGVLRRLVQVIERRGPLGPGGEQIYRVRLTDEWGQVEEFEQFESALELASAPTLTK